MSNNSNEPNPNVTIEEFFEPRISVDNESRKVHLFFGKTPRAQLSIDLDFGAQSVSPEMIRGLIVSKFPQGKLE